MSTEHKEIDTLYPIYGGYRRKHPSNYCE